jgi:hypothetical protein
MTDEELQAIRDRLSLAVSSGGEERHPFAMREISALIIEVGYLRDQLRGLEFRVSGLETLCDAPRTSIYE